MVERRPLIEGLNDSPPPPVDSARAKEFIYNNAKPVAAGRRLAQHRQKRKHFLTVKHPIVTV